MKNTTLVLSLIFVIFISVLGFCSLTIIKQEKYIKSLEKTLYKKDKVVSDSKQQLDNSNIKPELHPIEKAVQDCMQKENYSTFGMSGCVDESVNDWNKEINKYIAQLKEILPDEKYEFLKNSQKEWTDYKDAEWALLEVTIGEKTGSIYVNILSADKSAVLEKRAKDLSGLYFELTEGAREGFRKN